MSSKQTQDSTTFLGSSCNWTKPFVEKPVPFTGPREWDYMDLWSERHVLCECVLCTVSLMVTLPRDVLFRMCSPHYALWLLLKLISSPFTHFWCFFIDFSLWDMKFINRVLDSCPLFKYRMPPCRGGYIRRLFFCHNLWDESCYAGWPPHALLCIELRMQPTFRERRVRESK